MSGSYPLCDKATSCRNLLRQSVAKLDAGWVMQADEQDMEHGGSAAAGKSRKGQGRWLARWLVRDSSSRKQGRDKAGSKRAEEHGLRQKLETRSVEPRKPPAVHAGPGG